MGRFECSNCGAAATIARGDYRFDESGLNNVILVGVELVKCGECGNIDPIIPTTNDLIRALALAVIAQPYRLSGAEIRFLRKFLGKTGAEFSLLVGVDPTTLSKWENDHENVGPGAQSDRLIRTIVLAKGDDLQKELAWVLDGFQKIEDYTRQKDIAIDADKLSYEYA